MTAPDMPETTPATVADHSHVGEPLYNRNAPSEPPGSGAPSDTTTPRSTALLYFQPSLVYVPRLFASLD